MATGNELVRHIDVVVQLERIAGELERAASVEEIKDISDRAEVLQTYARKKKWGLEIGQHAGRIVTDATLKLARLYKEEKASRGPDNRFLDRKQETPGKKAIAQAAGVDPATLTEAGWVGSLGYIAPPK